MRAEKNGGGESEGRRYDVERRIAGDRRGLLRWDPRAKERRSGKERREPARYVRQ